MRSLMVELGGTESGKGDALRTAQREIEGVREIMTENIERVLDRGERLDLLVDKTGRLGDTARDFRVRSRGLRRRMWWKNVKLMVLLILVVVFLIYLFVAFGCGLPGKWNSPRNQTRTDMAQPGEDVCVGRPFLNLSKAQRAIAYRHLRTLCYFRNTIGVTEYLVDSQNSDASSTTLSVLLSFSKYPIARKTSRPPDAVCPKSTTPPNAIVQLVCANPKTSPKPRPPIDPPIQNPLNQTKNHPNASPKN